LAERLRLPVRTLYALVDRNEIPALRVGRLLRFRWDEVVDALEARRREEGPW
jgi:excisionase family DNA binding protein